MKVTCIANDTLRLVLEPETALERAFVAEMAEQSQKGAPTALRVDASEYVLEVGKP